MFEFEITTDLSTIPKSIDFNFEELKVEISSRCEYYNNLVVTEDGIKEAKQDKAKLNKLIKAIEDKRKEVKNECLKPYAEFEIKCKEIVTLITNPVTAIDTQIKVFDEKLQEEKYNTIKEAFKSICDVDYIHLDDIINPKWKNSTLKTEAVISELQERIVLIKSDLQSLEMQYADEPFFSAVKQEYCKSLNLSRAMQYANELSKIEQQRQESIRLEEERKQQQQAHTEPAIKQEEETEKPERVPEPASEPKGLFKGQFEVCGTREQILKLREFLNINQISFRVIRVKE